jgi:hypothetical protein
MCNVAEFGSDNREPIIEEKSKIRDWLRFLTM